MNSRSGNGQLISIVVPVYNEATNILSKGQLLFNTCESLGLTFEIVLVDDGSTDASHAELLKLKACCRNIEIVHYSPNRGLGYALRRGFAHARGDSIITIDADLSYGPEHIPILLGELEKDPSLDLVIGSVYMPGGTHSNVPAWRLWLSKIGNKVLSIALRNKISTITCVLRAYRASFIKSLALFSDGKEIHLEIIEKALALGCHMKEVPAHLEWEKQKKRRRGGFRLKSVMVTHILFSFSERPMILFGVFGLMFILFGLACGGYISYLWSISALNPNRPLISLMVLLIITGIQIFLFGFLGIEISNIRKELLRLQISTRSKQDEKLNG